MKKTLVLVLALAMMLSVNASPSKSDRSHQSKRWRKLRKPLSVCGFS